VRHAALIDRLRAGRRTPVVVVEAPAGYGKTTALSAWVGSDRRAVGWYSIDERDADPVVFLSYLAALLGRVGADIRSASDIIGAPSTSIPGAAAELAEALESLPAPAVIVIDNVHLLRNRACLDVVVDLLAHVADESQLVLATRSAHALPIAGLRAEGRLLALGTNDLRLTDAEADALLRSASVTLSDETVRSLNKLCDGWAAGLYLAALVARRSGGRLDQSLLGADRFVADYFHLELLDQLSTDDRDFLLEVSAVDRLTGPLCNAMLGRSGSDATLAALADANLFISALAGEPGWFRLHPLFREMLQAELSRRSPGRESTLRARASAWYEAEGDVEAAIECAIGAGDLDRTATLCGAAMLPTYWSGRAATVERWCSAIDDPAVLAKHPKVAIIGSVMFALGGQPEKAERWARAALRASSTESMSDGSTVGAWISNLRAVLCMNGVDAMREDAEQAVATLAEGSAFAPSARLLLGFAHLLGGHDDDAEEWLVASVDSALALGSNVVASVALAALAVIAGGRDARGEQDAYARHAREVVDKGRLGDYVSSAFVYAVEGRAALAQGRRLRAESDMVRADALISKLTYALPWLAVPTRVELARLHLAFDDPARARELLGQIDDVWARRSEIAREQVENLRHDLRAGRAGGESWTSALTPAELRLLPLLASYLSFREIAERLGISRNTVKTQAIAVYRKLRVSSRSEAVERAREAGLLKDTAPAE
jgi:LuxR family maltose regulon positive regulatory protein